MEARQTFIHLPEDFTMTASRTLVATLALALAAGVPQAGTRHATVTGTVVVTH